MFSLGRSLSKVLVKGIINPYKIHRYQFLFCTAQKINPAYQKIKKIFKEKGLQSQEYQKQMAKAMGQALSKQNNQDAVNLQLFHLGLVKQKQGQTSQAYRQQLKQVSKFFINNLQFDNAAKLVEQLKQIQSRIENLNPIEVVGTNYLLGYIYMEQGKLQQSKQQLNKCLEVVQVQNTPQVFFKIYAQLARVHARCNQGDQSLKKILKCQQILNNRQIAENSPPIVRVMDINDTFNITELASILGNKELSQKYLQMYQKKLEKCSSKKDPMYAQYLQRKAKVHFNLKQYNKAVQFLQEGVKLCKQISEKDPRLLQNVQILTNIIQFIKKQHIK